MPAVSPSFCIDEIYTYLYRFKLRPPSLDVCRYRGNLRDDTYALKRTLERVGPTLGSPSGTVSQRGVHAILRMERILWSSSPKLDKSIALGSS